MRLFPVLLLLGILSLNAARPWPNNGGQMQSKNYFLDFGTNDGRSVEYFFGLLSNKRLHSRGGPQGGGLNSPLFRMGQNGVWSVHLFEANPSFELHLRNTSALILGAFPQSEISTHVGVAVSTMEGEATFYVDDSHGAVGSSLLDIRRKDKPIRVKTVSVTKFLKALDLKREDLVVLKMDVEGAEFDILLDVISNNQLSLLDYLAIEWHDTNPFLGWTKEYAGELSRKRKIIEQAISQSATRVISWD